MVILGIDPGYAIVGYGVVDYKNNHFSTVDYGVVTTPAGINFAKRLELIYNNILDIIEKYRPDSISIEKLFFNSNTATAIAVAEARGVIRLAAQKCNVPAFEYTPLQVKLAVTGYGKAEKKQIMDMTRIVLGLDEIPKPDDTADALAVAICHAHSSSSIIGKLNLEENFK